METKINVKQLLMKHAVQLYYMYNNNNCVCLDGMLLCYAWCYAFGYKEAQHLLTLDLLVTYEVTPDTEPDQSLYPDPNKLVP